MMNQAKKNCTVLEGFTWRIKNFAESITYYDNMHYSPDFLLESHQWRIVIFRNRIDDVDYLSIYLDTAEWGDQIPDIGCENLKLTLINQAIGKMSITKETEEEFNYERNFYCGMQDVIRLDELLETTNGFIVNDTCIIRAEVISWVECEQFNIDLYSFEPVDLAYLWGLDIEKAFLPLLEEVCAWHPLVLRLLKVRNRSWNFVEWAFTALGRVLYFLKTTKVQDMYDYDFDHLQTLWEELEIFGLDLSWLAPHVEIALGMRGYIKKAAQVKKLKENVTAIDNNLTKATRSYIQKVAEMRMLKKDMDALAMDLKEAERNLVEAEEDFKKMGLDAEAELGYGNY